jgi:outer membrane protein insertion porin family
MTVRRLLFLLLFPVLAFGQQQYYGSRVSSLSLTGAANQSDLQAIPLKPGDLITAENIRSSIQTLYDTGRYRYIEVDGIADPGGTRLEFRVRRHFFLSSIRLEPEDLLDRSLSGVFRLPYGEKFSQSYVDRLVQDTTDLLHNVGYFEARIAPSIHFDESTLLATVTLVAENHNRADVGKITITGGEETFPDRLQLLDAFGLHTGRKFSADQLDRGVRNLREKFVNLEFGAFLNTRIEVQKNFHSETNTVDLNVVVTPGVFTLAEVQPRDLISQKQLKQLVPIYEEGAVDEDLIEEGRVQILSYMQQKGFFEAAVEKERIDAPLDNAVQINYKISPGQQHEIQSLRIEGNQHFTIGQIQARMKVRGPGVFGRGVFSPTILQQDTRAIEAMYRNEGFEDTSVTADLQETDHAVDIVISIKEGQQLAIANLSFEGNVQVPEAEVRERCALKTGDVYKPVDVETARRTLTSMYYSKGFPDARVDARVDRPSSGNVAVVFRITEGESRRIGKVLVSGNTLTADKIVRRHANLFEGTPFNPEAILDSQRRLYSSGLFSRVDVVPLDQGLSDVRNVLIQVEDARPILLTPSVGYQGASGARATLDVSHSNLFGLDRSINLRLRGTFLTPSPNSNRELRLQATYREPKLFNHNLDGLASVFLERTHQQAFDASRTDFSLQVLRNLSSSQNLLLTASYQNVNLQDIRVNPRACVNLEPDEECKFPKETGVIQIGRIGASYVRDHRNDPIDPTTGTFHTTTLQLASRAYGSEINFASVFNQSIFYHPLGSAVVAASFRLGWNKPFGVTTALPITERYFAGGSTTLRGFGQDKAGPEGGGDSMVIANVEYRKPLPDVWIRNIGGVLFYDTGSVFARVPNLQVERFSHTVGAGLRYQTPVGPVRLDAGYRLYPSTHVDQQDKRLHFFFTLGHTF